MADMTEQMAALLRYANYSEVARALGVERATVSKWARGVNVGPYQLEKVRDLMAQTVGPVIADAQRDARPVGAGGEPPEWATGLQTAVQAIITREEVHVLVGEVEGRVTTEIQTNRAAIIEALAGEFVDAAMRKLVQTPDGARLLESVDPLPAAGEPQPEQEPSDVR